MKSNKDSNKEQEEMFILTEEQRKEILLGIEQIERGEFITNEELEREDEWLNE